MLLSKRNTTCAIILLWTITSIVLLLQVMLSSRIDTTNSTHEYSAKDVQPNLLTEIHKEELPTINNENLYAFNSNKIKSIAEDIKAEATAMLNNEATNYDVPINTAPHIRSGKVMEGVDITIDIDKLLIYVDAEYDTYDWDSKRRIKDIYILKEILVNQLGVSPSKAAAIIGNICCEDSFAGLTNSHASLDNLEHAQSVLGNGTKGYGCVQWTAGYRQNGLEDYYEAINKDLDWELTSVIAETAYLYNELYVSGIIGDLTEDGELEHLTGVISCVYEAYADSTKEWYKVDGRYKTDGCLRYTYAKNVYELICNEVE